MNFGSNDDMFSGNLKIFKDLSELNLSLARSIEFSCIEVVDAILESDFDDLFVLFVGFSLVVDHVSEGNGGDFET